VAPTSSAQQGIAATQSIDQTDTEIPSHWIEGFYPIYEVAQSTFGVNWLLIASIHKQESAFSTDATTYNGLNFAGCCGGPMQFNVTNGPVTTWDKVRSAYRYGRRPAMYDHRTAQHPSIYDDDARAEWTPGRPACPTRTAVMDRVDVLTQPGARARPRNRR